MGLLSFFCLSCPSQSAYLGMGLEYGWLGGVGYGSPTWSTHLLVSSDTFVLHPYFRVGSNQCIPFYMFLIFNRFLSI